MKKRIIVSVPCRGLIFLNRTEPVSDWTTNQVSVPCRGLIFLNSTDGMLTEKAIGFRPLSGTYISQSCKTAAIETKKPVSVPCRGLIFLN